MAWITVTHRQIDSKGNVTVVKLPVNSDTVQYPRPWLPGFANSPGASVLRFIDGSELPIEETVEWWAKQDKA